MCAAFLESTARSYCKCAGVEPQSSRWRWPSWPWAPLCKTLPKSRDGGARLGKSRLYIEDPAPILTTLQDVRPPEIFSMYMLLPVRSLRGFVASISTCFLIHPRFCQKENSSVREQWSHCVGLWIQVRAMSLTSCVFVHDHLFLPERKGGVGPLRTAKEEK